MAISQANWVTIFKAWADIFKEALINFGSEAAKNVPALIDAIRTASPQADNGAGISAIAEQFRGSYVGVVSDSRMAQMLDPILSVYLKDLAINRGNIDPSSNFGAIYDAFVAANLHVQSRSPTFDIVPTETGTGNGTLRRLTVDHLGHPIESGAFPLDIRVEAILAESDGASPGAETFRISGPAGKDILQQGGGFTSDAAGEINSQNDDDLVLDHSFESVTADDADPSDLGSWLDSAGVYGSAKYAIGSSAPAPYMSSVREDLNGYAGRLEIKGNYTFQQEMAQVDPRTPIDFAPRFYRPSGTTSVTVTISWGSKSQVWTEADLTADAWVALRPTLDKDLYGHNWGDTGRMFTVAITNLTGGSIFADSVRVYRMIFWGGSWWAIDAGTTQFLTGANQKVFELSDTIDSDSIIQRLLALSIGRYLPHVPNATQVTASAGRTITFADGGGSPDTITASTGDFAADGYQAGMLVTVAGTTSNNGTFTLATVTATVLTLIASDALTNEGPLSATATLDATAAIVDP
jgi:hypothetical protein